MHNRLEKGKAERRYYVPAGSSIHKLISCDYFMFSVYIFSKNCNDFLDI